jgi:hypothetical protein
LLVSFAASDPGNAGLPVFDNGLPVDSVLTEGFWRFTARNSLSSDDYNVSLDGNGFTSHTIDTATRVLKRTDGGDWGIQGTHASAAGTVCYRNSMAGLSTVATDFCLAVISCSGGIIGDIDTVCAGDDLIPFVNYISPYGGSSPIYTWQFTTTLTATPGDANWTDIPGSNSLTYDYGTLPETTMFVRKTEATGCPDTYSNTVTIEALPVPATGPLYHMPND